MEASLRLRGRKNVCGLAFFLRNTPEILPRCLMSVVSTYTRNMDS